MRIKNLLKKITKVPKRYLAVVAAGLVIAVPLAVKAGFGPDRPTFDWNNNPGTCDLQANRGDRCGAISPVFNSFVNTPSYGDERNFTRIAEVSPGQSPTSASYTETQNAVAGKEYWVRTLVHNDANQNLNCVPEHRDATKNDCTQVDPGSPGIAVGTTVRLEIAGGVANGIEVMTKVSASNATPAVVWDTATLANSTNAFSVAYVPGSAVLFNGAHQSGIALPDSITGNGAPIGFNAMDGTIPGCFDFSAYVYVKVKVSAPALSFQKQVRFEGEDSSKWRSSLDAKQGDRVQYLLTFVDTGSTNDNNVVLRDKLPSNINLVPGSVKWIDSNRPNGTTLPDSSLFSAGGINLGNYGVHGGGYVLFTATVGNDLNVCEAENVAFARADNVPEESSKAKVVITNCKPENKTPVFSCDLLEFKNTSGRTYSFTTTATAKNGASVKSYTYNFGDGVTPLTTNQNPVSHTFAVPGTYQIKVTVNFNVNGVNKTNTSQACTKTITIPKEEEKCTVPGKENLPKNSPQCQPTPTPTVLVNTGPGDVIGIFTAVSLGAAFLHRRWADR